MTKMFSAKKVLLLGGTGLLGRALYDSLKRSGITVSATTRHKEPLDLGWYYLDVTDPASIAALPWSDFDTIIDCTGRIDYAATPSTAIDNLIVNTLGPIRILDHLTLSQHYIHCSTHVVLLPEKEQNSYSLTKKFGEEYLHLVEKNQARVLTFRLPALFADSRRTGLLYKIKTHWQERAPLSLDIAFQVWHAMYLPRVVETMITLLANDPREPVITIGYPNETAIETILAAAETSFGYNIPVAFTRQETDHYIPDVQTQQKYLTLSPDDFYSDLLNFFHAV